jgi:hypothetical protein
MRVMASDLEALDRGQALCARLIRTIRDHEAGLRALGVMKLWLFGSLARADARADSDVDVLIDIASGRRFSLLDLAEVPARPVRAAWARSRRGDPRGPSTMLPIPDCRRSGRDILMA